MSTDTLGELDVDAARHRKEAPDLGPRIGLWGRFEAGSFEELALYWIFEREIRRRLPDAEIRPYARLEEAASGALDGGFAPADLGDWSSPRAQELADTLDCVVVAGGKLSRSADDRSATAAGSEAQSFFVEGLGRRLERRSPVVWSSVAVPFDLDPEIARRIRVALASRPHVAVRDEASRDRLRKAGVKRRVTVLPDPLWLLPRAFPPDLVARRLEYLRHMEWFPGSGEPLVVQGSQALSRSAEALANCLARVLGGREVPVVLIELDPVAGDGKFLDALSQRLALPAFRPPPSATLTDLVAVLSHARGFVGSSERGCVASAAFGVPAVLLDLPSRNATAMTSRPDQRIRRASSAAGLLPAIRWLFATRREGGAAAAIEERLDAHFDSLAGIAKSAMVARVREDGEATVRLLSLLRENERLLRAWREAYAARTRQVVDERLRLAALLEKRESEWTEGSAQAAAELERLRGETSRLSDELAGLSAALAARDAERELSGRRTADLTEALEAATGQLAGERMQREDVERRLAGERDRTTGIEEELARERTRARREAANLRGSLENLRGEAARRERRAEEQLAEIRRDLDRARSQLEKARSDSTDLRVSQTLLLTEVFEARADASGSEACRQEVEESLARAERGRDLALSEVSRLEAERTRAIEELTSLQTELERLSAERKLQIPTSLRTRIHQAVTAREPRGQT